MFGLQGSVLDVVGCVVDQDGSVLHLQDLDAVSHHGRHDELAQLQQIRNESAILLSCKKGKMLKLHYITL